MTDKPMTLTPIARIRSPLTDKFGIPRQSGLADGLRATIVFEPPFRNADAVRGLEGFSHIWLIWGFSETAQGGFSPTVRPPRLGGNTRMGVFATRSPFRPNPLGLSSVALEEVALNPRLGPVLTVLGADLMDGTPIYDIKPYLPYTDCHPQAQGGFAPQAPGRLRVDIPPRLAALLPQGEAPVLESLLALDPRPAYQNAPGRVYGMAFGGYQVRFTVEGDVCTVTDILPPG